MADRISLPFKFWSGGVNSLLHPTDIGEHNLAWAENVLVRGGFPQTRPGLLMVGKVLGTRLQGFGAYQPRNSTTRLVIIVDGKAYVGQWPRFDFVQIPDVQFNPAAPLVNVCSCWQSTKHKTDGSIEVIDPINVLMMGDGETQTVFYDGTTAKVMSPIAPDFQTPSGLWMAWAASRLWIASGSKVRVSDFGDPTSFTDDNFLATRSNFELPDTCTGLIEAANERGVLAFTRSTTTAFQSSIYDRTQWQTTSGFQKVILPEVGCDAGRTACNQYGLTYWHSLQGFVGLDAALNTAHTSRLVAIDSEMMRSKRNLSPDMSKAAAIAFENLMFISVPSGGRYNEQTWVYDQAPVEDLGQQAIWSGVWTGIRPVQWAQGKIGGRDRLYAACYDKTPAGDTHIHIWEALREDRNDQGGRIHCQVQTGTVSDSQLMTFRYVEFEVHELLGDVTLEVFVMGTRGPWNLIGTFELRAEIGSIGSRRQLIIESDSILQAYKPQTRTLKTKEINPQGKDGAPENKKLVNQDKGFALLFVWRGQMGIHDIKLIVEKAADSMTGECGPDETGQLNIVTEEGVTIK